MLIVNIPISFSKEITYTIEILLNEFLGVDYIINSDNHNIDFSFELNSKSITIKNTFFSKFIEKTDYLSNDNVPKNITYLTNKEYKLNNLPILFGNNKFEETENKIILYSDIIASAFFMLSRWEEYTNKSRDKHNRFIAAYSLANRFNFLERPIVNEYADFLYQLLEKIGYAQPKKQRKFKITPTHDVDIPFYWKTKLHKYKSVAISIYQLKFEEAFCRFKHLVSNKDPYDTFDYLMNLANKNNLKSHFFFMSGGNTNYDNRYSITDKRIIELIQKIKDKGHNVGFHPSYNSYNNIDFLKTEKELISKNHNTSITFGRQHYLRFENPTTWQLWEDLKMDWDSTLSFADKTGFRCGTCYPFPVFNILTRKKLNLIERPLIVMESTLVGYEKLTPKNSLLKIKKLKDEVKKHNGEFVFLWHNSSFNTQNWLKYKNVLLELYKN